MTPGPAGHRDRRGLRVRAATLLLNLETGNQIQEYGLTVFSVSQWSFLTNHARCLVLIAHDPGLRLRDIAATLDITERSAHGIVTNLAEAGYVLKEKEGRRNRYQIQAHLPLGEGIGRERTIGEVLDLLVDASTANRRRTSGK